MPGLVVSFVFQYYFLQVATTLRRTKYSRSTSNNNRKIDVDEALVLGKTTTWVMFLIYFIVFCISWAATPPEDRVYRTISNWQIVRDVILCVFGSNPNLNSFPIIIVGHLGVVVQLMFHMPFIFFIGKEHILQCIDEHYNQSLSLMIDRIKNKFKGDPRFFLAQRKFNLRSDSMSIDSSRAMSLKEDKPSVYKSHKAVESKVNTAVL